MGYIAEDIIEKIKSDTDILELVGEYVNLKKAGKDYIGLCPFHREKTPSFTVVPAKGFYYCFGCGASGNAIGFIMRHENLDYAEAIKFLARRAGITIPEKGSADSLVGKLYKATEYALNFFKRNLKNSTGYDYIKSRGISDDIIAELEIGFAPGGWDNLYKATLKDKLSPEIFEKAGLIIKSDKGSGHYDKFRNRLVFPIKSISGRVVGFGGRALSDDDAPKYLNSPETAIYHKGSVLYGLNWSKNYIRNLGKVIIAEGYFDFISLYQAGIKNVVAVSGTGFTPNQGSLLARFCSDVVLLYDADSAGMKATFRAVEIIYNSGLEPYVVRLSQGSDPDSYVRLNGREVMIKIINEAIDYLRFVNQSLPDKFNNLPISRQEKVIKSLVETAAGIEDELRYELFVRKAIEIFNLPGSAAAKFQRSKRPKGDDRISRTTGRVKLEQSFLGFLFANPEFIKESLQVLKPENFVDKQNREVFIKLNSVGSVSAHDRAAKFSVGDLLEQFLDDGIRRKITEIIINETAGAPADLRFSEFIAKFKNLQISDKREYLLAEIAKAEKEGDVDRADKLTREYQDLRNVASRKVV